MTQSLSLRVRLTGIILVPLLLIALGIGIWASRDAQMRAAERFDRSLFSTALAISRDVAVAGGDALSEATRDALRDTSGGPVFYHVFAPDGVFVTGYATPPIPPEGAGDAGQAPFYYDAVYQRRPVRAFRLEESLAIDGLQGPFTFTVWQDTVVRDGFVRSLTQRTAIVIATMIAGLALIVWFGIRIGLRPLDDLDDAIAKRSVEDLSPIRRPIPQEVRDLVATLNRLLGDLSQTLKAKDDFISNAAHQLRNPIAGVQSLTDALDGARTDADRAERQGDLKEATRELSKLADGLLTLERARAAQGRPREEFDLAEVLMDLAPRLETLCRRRNVTFHKDGPETGLRVAADPLLIEQAVLNLVNNSLIHAGEGLTRIGLSVELKGRDVTVTVRDDGRGLTTAEAETALARFGQVRPAEGSGLGLPIAQAAAEAFGGHLTLEDAAPGLKVVIRLPRVM